MANEEIEISELEYTEEVAPDNLIPIESATDTKATSLQVLRDWFKSFFVSKTGDEDIGGKKTFTNEIIGNANIYQTAGQLRIVQGKYGAILRNDGDKLYFLTTAENDPYGSWDSTKVSCRFNLIEGSFESKSTDAIQSVITTTGIQKAGNGYLRMGNGIIIQWGQMSASSTQITFPIAFSNTNYQFVDYTSISQDSNTLTMHPIIYNNHKTTTGIVVKVGQYGTNAKTDSNYTHNWIAIGY